MTNPLGAETQQPNLAEAMIDVMQQIRHDFDVNQVFNQLDALVAEAKNHISDQSNPDLALEELLSLFYQQWGFGSCQGVYRLSDALWLDNVLMTRRGSAVSLGAILLYIADKLELPLYPVIFPTQLILRADWVDGDMWLINPFNGETLDDYILERWVKGTIGPSACLYLDDLEEAATDVVLRKMLDTLKTALMEEQQMELALKVSQVLLTIDPDDPYEIRDRGLIYAQLECEHIALHDLTYFIDQCPEDPVSEMIKIQIHAIQNKHIVLH